MKRFLSLLLAVFIVLPVPAAFAGDPVPVQAITLSATEGSIPVGKRLNLKADVEPRNASNKQLEWTSSDESIATVKYGQVSGLSQGTVTITATAADGSGVSASATVTVVNPVTKIIPEERQLTLPPGVGWELFWTVEPADATNKAVTWVSGNEQIATVNENGVIFTHKSGICKLTAQAGDGSGVRVVVNLTVKPHDILILKPGQVDVDFETENTTVAEKRIVNGKETTVKQNRYFKTDNGCVIAPMNMVLVPVKAGSDTISIQYIERRKTAKIEKHTVFVSRNAVGEAAVYTEEGAVTGPIRFLNLPWGASHPEVKEIIEYRGGSVKTLAINNDDLRAMIGETIPFASLTAFSAALNYSYDHSNRLYEVKNSLFKGDLYFDPEIPFEEIVKAAKNVYALDQGQESAGNCAWERDHVKVTLTQKERFTQLEIVWDGTPVEAEEEPEVKHREEAKPEGESAGDDDDDDDDDYDDDDYDDEDDDDEDYDDEDDEDYDDYDEDDEDDDDYDEDDDDE